MKRLIFAALAFVALAQPAFAETMQRPSGAIVPSAALMCPNGTTNADGSQQVVPCGGSSVPIQVGGTFSATISGFTPGLTFATLTATNVSASVALPAGVTVVFQNTGTTAVSCTLGVGAATAAANEIIVQPGSSRPVVVGSNTFGACIDQSGSVSNLVVLMGGSGLDTGFGGGGSGGGGGAITAAASSYAAGAFSAGAGVDGWDLTQGTKADAACVGDNTSGCSVEARLQRIAQNLTTLNTSVNASVPAGTNIIGKVGIDQTTPGTTNGVQVNAALPAGANLIGKVTLNDGTNSAVTDPCQGTVTTTPISISAASTTVIVPGTSAKNTYVCGMMLFSAGTTNVGIVQGSGVTCGTSTLGLIGGATAATGPNLTAQAGFNASPAGYHIAATTVNANDICLINGSAIQVSGYIATAVR